MPKSKDDKLNINLRLEKKDQETHYHIKRLMNFQSDTQIVYYMYGQFRRYMGENPDYIIDLKQALDALETVQNLTKKVDQLSYELEKMRQS